MKKLLTVFLSVLFAAISVSAEEWQWKAKWITCESTAQTTNTWISFRKDVKLEKVPRSVTARISADSKYWLWVNGEIIIREGCLKRGPKPGDGYYDKIEIAPFLKDGENSICILLWYFGRGGLSHLSSGTAAVLFEAVGDGVEIISDGSWSCKHQTAFSTMEIPDNFKLSESSIRFDARMYDGGWTNPGQGSLGAKAKESFLPGEPPLGDLVERPIPMWKDYGLKEYESVVSKGDTLVCSLPYNCQMTPWLKVDAPAGCVIGISTDHDIVGGLPCIKAEYITRGGEQEFECFGWMNGEKVCYIIPEGVEVKGVKFRETGYDTEFSGYFRCNEEFFNEYWKKSVRTVYVCMRDTYYDCPDRERAQWCGDAVSEMAASFYAFSPSASKLARKGMYELIGWQMKNGVIHSPVPTTSLFDEYPAQSLAAIGWYGFHDYWKYSGDDSFIADLYPGIRKYIHEVYTLDADGLPVHCAGEFSDWQDADDWKGCDKEALMPLWYYLALKGECSFARKLGKTDDVEMIEAEIKCVKDGYNARFWTGREYRTPGYVGVTDDRVQALAVVTGIAEKDKYPALKDVLSTQFYAATYFTRYVVEALFLMGEEDMALDRIQSVLGSAMTDDCSTLSESVNRTGTPNHGWSGGAIFEMGRKIAGIEPVEPGFKTFKVAPRLGRLQWVESGVDTPYGLIEIALYRERNRIKLMLTVPQGTKAEVLVKGKPHILEAGNHKLWI